MPKLLSQAQIARYREEGCLAPIRIMSEAEAMERDWTNDMAACAVCADIDDMIMKTKEARAIKMA